MEELIREFIQEVLLGSIIKFGALIRWFFLRKKYSYKEVLKQDWNGRVGLLFIILIAYLIFSLIS